MMEGFAILAPIQSEGFSRLCINILKQSKWHTGLGSLEKLHS